jgi:ABC-type Fe3+/spermidine/putrescine transport system ATPase subunit
VLQAGTRASVFRAPDSPQVAALLGIANAHRGVALGGGAIRSGGVELYADATELAAGTEVAWAVRPERIELRTDGRYAATLLDDANLGTERELIVALGGALPGEGLELTVRTLEPDELAIGQVLRIELPSEHFSVWASG